MSQVLVACIAVLSGRFVVTQLPSIFKQSATVNMLPSVVYIMDCHHAVYDGDHTGSCKLLFSAQQNKLCEFPYAKLQLPV